jgi:hypothetical protein
VADKSLELMKDAVYMNRSVAAEAGFCVVGLNFFRPEKLVSEGAEHLDMRKILPLLLSHGLFIDSPTLPVNEIRRNIFHLTGSWFRVY